MKPVNAEPHEPVLVVCLCAEWCGVCRDYSGVFSQMQSRFREVRFRWIDVEDESELLHPMDVENFPTLLIIRAGKPRYFGPVRPQPEILERLIRVQIEGADAQALANPAVEELTNRIQFSSAAA